MAKDRFGRGARLMAALPLLVLACGFAPAVHAARPVAPATSTFYPASADAYANWKATNEAPPPAQGVFPRGTTEVAFFVEFTSPGSHAGLIVVLRHGSTTVRVSRARQVAPTAFEAAMVALTAPVGTFANGTYGANLVQGGHVLAATIVRIGGAVDGVTISSFRVSSSSAVDRWVKQKGFYPLPARISVFPAGTKVVGSVFLFKGAKPQVTAEQIVADGPHGLRVVSGQPRVLKRASDGIYEYLYPPRQQAYPKGRYTAIVLIDRQQAAQITFTVR